MSHETRTTIDVRTRSRTGIYLSVAGVMGAVGLGGVAGDIALAILVGFVFGLIGAVCIYLDMRALNRDAGTDYTPALWAVFAVVFPGITGALYLSDRHTIVGHW